MADAISIAWDHRILSLHPERDDDRAFRFMLFCESRLPEWAPVDLEPSA